MGFCEGSWLLIKVIVLRRVSTIVPEFCSNLSDV